MALRIITQPELDEILKSHKLWLDTRFSEKTEGERANLRGANLSWANLSWANLSWANLGEANLRGANLSWANLSWANLGGANLGGCSNDLQQADMRGKDLDFTVIPLSCRSLKWKIDRRLAVQFLYHFCSHYCEDADIKTAQNNLLALANEFHRVEECGKIEPKV